MLTYYQMGRSIVSVDLIIIPDYVDNVIWKKRNDKSMLFTQFVWHVTTKNYKYVRMELDFNSVEKSTWV